MHRRSTSGVIAPPSRATARGEWDKASRGWPLYDLKETILAKAKRVFEIAKTLGVTSKAIVAKCQAEGVPGITNHMSTVKIGLVQTITEWFSEEDTPGVAAAHTAVEVAEKVDLTKARARRRRAAASKTDDVSLPEVAVAKEAKPKVDMVVQEAQAEAQTQVVAPEPAPKAPSESVTVEPQAVVGQDAQAAPVPPAVEPPVEPTTGSASEPQDATSRARVVKPAGVPLTKPKEATLKGPTVVRIEKPDAVDAPRPRRLGPTSGGGGGHGPTVAPSGEPPTEVTRPRGPARGRGAGGVEGEGTRRAAPKRRSLSTRRGRSADALPIGPSKFSEQDLIELDARLNRATGFLKQRRRQLNKPTTVATAVSPVVSGGKVEIAEPVTIKTLSAATGIKSADIIKYLFQKGVMATINSAIDAEAAIDVAMEYDIELEVKEQQTAEQLVLEEFEKRTEVDVRARPPVVTVLGHVDHGKTSLLDRIRAADVAAHEAGGITQHVGAHRVTIRGHDEKEKTVVFLDTPGHEAFTSMRARGARMTDLIVLVVAADDGVMPQTIESINHARAAGVPIIVAMNKIDKAEATEENIRKIYGQLAEHGLNPVEWGGGTEVIKVSAIDGTGITELLELLDYQAELLELKADYGGPARGTVIEAQIQPGRGPVARALVQQGCVRVGDFVVIGRAFGRVRDMADDRGHAIKEAGPATPLELSGIDRVPDAGNKFYVTDTLGQAEKVAMQYREAERNKQLASKTKITLDNFADQLAAGDVKDLRVVLKADVQGSIDVLRKTLCEIGSSEVVAKVLHSAVGGINESDVLLADASDAVIIGFHVVASPRARDLAEQHGVDIRLYRVIYDLTEDLTKALEGMLEPETKEQELGVAEVRQLFKVSKVGLVAGCLATEGMIQRTASVRVVRDDVVVAQDRKIESLRRVKEDVREVRAGTECGIKLLGFDDLKVDDKLVCYNTVTVSRKLG